ncbi:hypothetical protein WN48_03469 [Eufriesea mexicana]|nr:hypothetical protein WN48_03469 [Eufriesea mexicana]
MWSHTGGLLARSTTSIRTSTVRDKGGKPLSLAIASSLYISRYTRPRVQQTGTKNNGVSVSRNDSWQ